MVWLRPQFELTALSLVSMGLTRLLTTRWQRRAVLETVATTVLALMVASYGARYWQRMMPVLANLQDSHYAAASTAIAAGQDPHALEIAIATHMQPPPTPPALSSNSVEAIHWAYQTSMHVVAQSAWIVVGTALFALVVLRRRGLAFLVPILTPAGFIIGTAAFARGYPAYRDNAWALERLQLVTSVFAAGTLAALHFQLRRTGESGRAQKELS
jgi:hypothetical protein